ncbi:uncharacterized protein LOC101855202 [Aplysia californica]|uniref:Uncharacterized protein LOC101855202 n=1 Tax=Aplysia californica TaxID=6500 RepID=A0ABM0JXD6_APLCA|nr:uncharacterized protein LOC101855202 [Aplysia californica]
MIFLSHRHRRISKPAKFDKKYMVFGEKPEEGETEAEEKHFLAMITRTLRDALDGLLTTAEVFYRQKGAHAVTRPQALQETFEQFADIITHKMQSYYQQADQYHNQCLQAVTT